jgi:4-hydroxybenzoate polyprenyltransferase
MNTRTSNRFTEGFAFVYAKFWHRVGLAALLLSQVLLMVFDWQEIPKGEWPHVLPLTLLLTFLYISIVQSASQRERHVVFFFSTWVVIVCWFCGLLVYICM